MIFCFKCVVNTAYILLVDILKFSNLALTCMVLSITYTILI